MPAKTDGDTKEFPNDNEKKTRCLLSLTDLNSLLIIARTKEELTIESSDPLVEESKQ